MKKAAIPVNQPFLLRALSPLRGFLIPGTLQKFLDGIAVKKFSLAAIPLIVIFFLTACSTCIKPQCTYLASISILDANDVSEIISNEDRLRQYQDVNFLAPQPYKKVLRVYKRDEQGNITACITTYHENGELKQYLDVLNGRAHGSFLEWHENGMRKIEAKVIGGTGDLYPGVENSWLFDGTCFAYTQEGSLEAEIPYCKGVREGLALFYHTNGSLWKEIPMHNDKIDGCIQISYDDGSPLESTLYAEGARHGVAVRYWKCGRIAFEEEYDHDKLIEGRYFSMTGELVSEITEGEGFKAIFGKERVHELQEYRKGVQEGLVQILGPDHEILRTYSKKNGCKHGEEIDYHLSTGQPKLSISWSEGKIQGVCKTWYANGVQESQREMANNKKMGLLTAWYNDGSLMLIEHYDQDKLVKGEYFEKGNSFPVSTISEGTGTAALYDAEGRFTGKVSYHQGRPEI